MRAVTKNQMIEMEQQAVNEYKIPSLLLMENAAMKVFSHCERILNHTAAIVTVVCGTGNNGGDGFAIARQLHQNGYHADVIIIGDTENIKGDALINFNILEKLNISLMNIKNLSEHDFINIISTSQLVVDAIFGTGLKRDIEGDTANYIAIINKFGKYILSVDVPSGTCSDTGETLGTTVIANETVCLGLMKIGLLLYSGKVSANKIHVEDISLPKITLKNEYAFTYFEDFEISELLPKRKMRSNKGSFGKTLVFAGSAEMTGAPFLCSKAIYKIGGGLVKGCFIESVAKVIQNNLPEIVCKILPSGDNYSPESFESVKDEIENCSCMVLGPGIGTSVETKQFISQILNISEKKVVIDADALNILSTDLSILETLKCESVITPHPKEMSRLTNLSVEEVLKNPIEVAKNFATWNNVTVVLKDSTTVVVSPKGQMFLNTTGNSSLAKGGTGDVLTGIIAGLISQGLDVYDASCLGVYIHGKTAEIASQKTSEYSLLASELIDYLGECILHFKNLN